MREFITKFIPFGNFAWLVSGFLLSERFSAKITGSLFYYLFMTLFLLVIAFLLRYFKLIWLAIGSLLFCGYILYLYPPLHEKKVNFIPQDDWDRIVQSDSKVKIKLRHELRRGFWSSDVQASDVSGINIVRYYHKKGSLIPEFECDANQFKTKQPDENRGDYFSFLRRYGDFYVVLPVYKCDKVGFAQDFRREIRNTLETILESGGLTDYSRDISMGLIFGDSSYLSQDFKQKAREGGILHLFAASGLHIGILIGFIFVIIQKIPFLNYYAVRILPVLIAFGYLYALNFPVSLTRAYGFAVIVVIASLFFRKIRSMDLMLITAFIIYLFDPENYLSLSFLLSFCAVGGIFFFKSELDRLLFQNHKNFLTENLSVSLSATIGTFPILVYYFKSFSFGSILINLILVPLTSFILPILYTSIGIELIKIPVIKDILWTFTDLLLRIQAYLSEHLGTQIGYYKEMSEKVEFSIQLYAGWMMLLFVLIALTYSHFFELKTDDLMPKKFIGLRRWLRFILSFASILIVFSFFAYLFHIIEEKKRVQQKQSHAGTDFFIIRNHSEVYLGGICKYSFYKIKSIFQNQFCDNEIKTVQIEEETCLALALICMKDAKNSILIAKDEIVQEWKPHLEQLNLDQAKEKKRFDFLNGESLIVFQPGKDSVRNLLKEVSKGQGSIMMVFPYGSKDNAENWNLMKKALGIRGIWKFISPNEL